MVFLTCPHLLSLGFLLILPCRSSPLSIHHPFWKETMHQNRILFQMMAQPLAIPFFLPCQCSHLLIFHVMVPHPSFPLSIRQFPNLSIHHQVPPEMNPIHLPCRFSLLHIIHIFPHRLSLLRIIHINLPLPSSPPFYTSKDDTNHPSMSNSNPSSTHTPTTVGHPYSFRYYQPEI